VVMKMGASPELQIGRPGSAHGKEVQHA